MKQIFIFLTRNQSNIYKLFLFGAAIVLVIYMLPKGGQFKYQFQKGKPWQYENLYAPFNFTLKKDKDGLDQEREQIRRNAVPYFDVDSDVPLDALKDFSALLDLSYQDSTWRTPINKAKERGLNLVNQIYKTGVLTASGDDYLPEQMVYLKTDNQVRETVYSRLIEREELNGLVDKATKNMSEMNGVFRRIINTVVQDNITYNSTLTDASIEQALKEINPNNGMVEKGARVIAKGEVVEGDKYQRLASLKDQFQSQVWSQSNYYWLVFGYALLVSLVFMMLFLFLQPRYQHLQCPALRGNLDSRPDER